MAFSYPYQGACPFGLCLRPVGENSPAFASWNYHPPYLPPSIAIAVGNNSEILTEPMLFQIPFGQRPDRLPLEKAQPLDHPVGWREMTRLTLISPVVDQPSPEVQAVAAIAPIQLQTGPAYCIELGFDGEHQGQEVDLRSALPLVLSW